MQAVNIVEKVGPDGFVEKSWVMPSDIVKPLRAHVRMTPDGWVMDLWPVTEEIAAIVQPWVDEPIGPDLDAWIIGSEQAS
jgi:hypothetical protein